MDAQTLSLPISTLSPNRPCSVEIGTTVTQAIKLMQDSSFGCLLVIDSRGRLVGIITERDILVHVVGKGLKPTEISVDDVMTRNPESLRASDPIAFALNHMHLGHYRHVPLVASDGDDMDSYPIGIISSRDITKHVAAYLQSTQEELSDVV